MKIIVEKIKKIKKKKKIAIVKNNIAIRIAGKVSRYIDASMNRATPDDHQCRINNAADVAYGCALSGAPRFDNFCCSDTFLSALFDLRPHIMMAYLRWYILRKGRTKDRACVSTV